MKLQVLSLSLILCLAHGLPAVNGQLVSTEVRIAPLQAAITALDVETVRTLVAGLETAADAQEILKDAKVMAKAARSQLTIQLMQDSQKSRLWAGAKALWLAWLAYKTSKNGHILAGFVDIIEIIINPGKILNIEKWFTFAPKKDPQSPKKSYQSPKFNYLMTAIILLVATKWSYKNAKFAYYGTSLTAQKLAKIEQIIAIIKAAQATHSQQ